MPLKKVTEMDIRQVSEGRPVGATTDLSQEPENSINSGTAVEGGMKGTGSEKVLPNTLSLPVIILPVQTKEPSPKIELDYTIPVIQRYDNVGIHVPLLRLQPASFSANKVELDEQIPSIPKEELPLYVPILNLKLPTHAPHNYRTECASHVQGDWVVTYAELCKEKLVERENLEATPPDLPSGGDSGEPENFPDVTDYIFGVKNSDLSTRRPKIILYKELGDDNTLATFETFCLRAYREQVGGTPVLRPISNLDETIATDLSKWVNPGKHLITLNFDYFNQEDAKRWLEQKNLRDLIGNLRDLIGKAITPDYGFVIFKSQREDLVWELKQQIQERSAHEIGHPLDILVVEPKSLSIDEKRRISSIIWGNCTPPTEGPKIVFQFGNDTETKKTFSSHDLDGIFNKACRAEYEKEFSSFARGENRLYQIVTKRGPKESDEHYLMKCYVVRYLARKHQLKEVSEIGATILTEEAPDFGPGVKPFIPDIYDRQENKYYEVETLFAGDRNGRGLIVNHLSETILKYKSDRDSTGVCIVIDNFTAARHMGDLLWLERTFREQEIIPVDVSFLTFDIPSKGLVSIQEVNRKMQGIMRVKP